MCSSFGELVMHANYHWSAYCSTLGQISLILSYQCIFVGYFNICCWFCLKKADCTFIYSTFCATFTTEYCNIKVAVTLWAVYPIWASSFYVLANKAIKDSLLLALSLKQTKSGAWIGLNHQNIAAHLSSSSSCCYCCYSWPYFAVVFISSSARQL